MFIRRYYINLLFILLNNAFKISKLGTWYYFLDPDGHKLEVHVGDWKTRIDELKKKPWNFN